MVRRATFRTLVGAEKFIHTLNFLCLLIMYFAALPVEVKIHTFLFEHQSIPLSSWDIVT